MGFFGSIIQRLSPFTPADPLDEKSPKLLATPTPLKSPLLATFSLPSSAWSSASPSRVSSFPSRASSPSSSFWRPPRTPTRRSPRRYVSSTVRNTRRQITVVVCLALALILWTVPFPHFGRKQIIHVNLQHALTTPYRALLPGLIPHDRGVLEPQKWLEQNSDNKFGLPENPNLLDGVMNWKTLSSQPRAALISLVRNSELEGMVQSMRSLELHWNRKYRYPWIFFNDEPFSDEFKVGLLLGHSNTD